MHSSVRRRLIQAWGIYDPQVCMCVTAFEVLSLLSDKIFGLSNCRCTHRSSKPGFLDRFLELPEDLEVFAINFCSFANASDGCSFDKQGEGNCVLIGCCSHQNRKLILDKGILHVLSWLASEEPHRSKEKVVNSGWTLMRNNRKISIHPVIALVVLESWLVYIIKRRNSILLPSASAGQVRKFVLVPTKSL